MNRTLCRQIYANLCTLKVLAWKVYGGGLDTASVAQARDRLLCKRFDYVLWVKKLQIPNAKVSFSSMGDETKNNA
jgi:hypothetical protein